MASGDDMLMLKSPITATAEGRDRERASATASPRLSADISPCVPCSPTMANQVALWPSGASSPAPRQHTVSRPAGPRQSTPRTCSLSLERAMKPIATEPSPGQCL